MILIRLQPTTIRNNHSGIALVIVLSMMALLTGLVLAFFSTVTFDASGSSVYSNDVQCRQLADTVSSLVMGQIVEATSGFERTSPSSVDYSKPLVWASQPGAIRTYKSAGTPDRIFKLYSSRNLVSTPTDFLKDIDPANPVADASALWSKNPATFTDLNSPVKSPNGDDVYPIADPRAKADGFSIDSADSRVASNPGAPMPVQWLYLLKSGTITTPNTNPDNSGTAQWLGSGNYVPTPTNPIVARIAYWTDDETCKVNINTASDGTYWDTPRADTTEERGFAKYQPAQKEFQRYPGHPATTSLAPVLFPGTDKLTDAQKEAIYGVTPRVVGGGSREGTTVATAALTPDKDRLYGSVDELLFSLGQSNNERITQDSSTGISASTVEHARFLLTANSRAPEVNLFGMPRVALWPIFQLSGSQFDMSRTTPSDRLIAFCSTVNGFPFYFQRTDPKSPVFDFEGISRNKDIYGYLKRLARTSFPGYEGSFQTKYGEDSDQILTEIFDYIRCTNLDDNNLKEANRFADMAEVTPGSDAKPGSGQITPIQIGATHGFGRFPAISELGVHFICTARSDNLLGSNTTSNLTLGGTLLTGSTRRVEAMFFYELAIPGQGWPRILPAFCVEIKGLEKLKLNGTALFSYPGAEDVDLASYTDPRSYFHGRDWGGTLSQRYVLSNGYLPARGVMPTDDERINGSVGRKDVRRYPFVSAPVTISETGGTMDFEGATLTINIRVRESDTYPGYNPSVPPVVTYTIPFASGRFPLPDLVTTGTPDQGSGSSATPATTPQYWWTFSRDGTRIRTTGTAGRLRFLEKTVDTSKVYAGAPFRAEDVVRTMVPSHADSRLIVASGTVPTGLFVKHPKFDDLNTRLAHSIVEAAGSGFFNEILANDKFAPGVAYSTTKAPDVPIYDSRSTSGDWDNGTSLTVDGAYLNKPDEGNVRGINSADKIPYFDDYHVYEGSSTFFSPNRQMPSAGMLGSLPTGVKSNVPFRTLLFRPQANHFGATNPPDHVMMDLFWMPVVEPYAISEPFSTAGKINMNYAMVPFDYITRSTAMIGLLRSEKLMVIPTTAGSGATTYKGPTMSTALRKPIQIDATLSQFQTRFVTNKDLFRSPTEIATLHLVPTDASLAEMDSYWSKNALTGDNARERPYTNLVGRLTTKSNTFTVHFKVQVLRKAMGTPANAWIEGQDQVASEYRGSTILERYIDPSDPRLPDFATETDPAKTNIDSYYRFRTVSGRRFAP